MRHDEGGVVVRELIDDHRGLAVLEQRLLVGVVYPSQLLTHTQRERGWKGERERERERGGGGRGGGQRERERDGGRECV
jgi:hypothetical protein